MKHQSILFMIAFVLVFISCDNENEQKSSKLSNVEIIQCEEVSDSPLSLAFSWMPVDNADRYEYSLWEFVEDYSASTVGSGTEKIIADGITSKCGKMFVASDALQLYSGTRYVFKVVATSLNGNFAPSEQASTDIVTGSGPFTMSITNMTYRSADFKVVPSDNNMLYQCATIDLYKYSQYDSDSEFIQTYDFGYYKKITDVWSLPMPWYEYMKSKSEKKTKTYSSRSLSPGSEYIFYAYKTEYTGDESDPVKFSGFTKKIFTTPLWEPVSDGTFNVTVKSQTMMESGTEVNVEVAVIPSNPEERYSVFFIPEGSVDKNVPFNTIANLVRNYELLGGITSWDTSGYTWKGERTVSSSSIALSDQAHVAPGASYCVAVFGLDDIGCITTEIQVLEFTSISR